MKSRKVGYKCDSDRLDPEGEISDQLRMFPSMDLRTRVTPKLAHHEACSYLHLSMMPESSEALTPEGVHQRHETPIVDVLGPNNNDDTENSDSDSGDSYISSDDQSEDINMVHIGNRTKQTAGAGHSEGEE
jgi:hypothetical protein